MNQQELDTFKAKLAELARSGSRAELRSWVNEHYARLPQDMQQEILFSVLSDTVSGEADLSRDDAA